MDNPFSFLKDESQRKTARSTRRQSIRHMKYSCAYQQNITSCAASTLQKKYVGKLGAHWTFPSDHLPVGATIESFRVASWNVLNDAYLFWIARDVQGLASSAMLKPRNRARGALIIEMCLSMIHHPSHPKELLALQECSPTFLKELKASLPPHFDLAYREEDTPNLLAILYNKNFFTFHSIQYAYPFSTDPNKEVMNLFLTSKDKLFRFVNVHVPGDPASPARFELGDYLSKELQKQIILLGDMNFTEWEMTDAFIRKTEEFIRCKNTYPTNVGCDLYAKQIDHIFTTKDLSSTPLSPEEVLPSLRPHVDLMMLPPLA